MIRRTLNAVSERIPKQKDKGQSLYTIATYKSRTMTERTRLKLTDRLSIITSYNNYNSIPFKVKGIYRTDNLFSKSVKGRDHEDDSACTYL